MTKIKDKTDKIILFVNDDEQETRYVTAKLEDDELIISFSNFNHAANKYVVHYRYKFNEKETQKFIKLLANSETAFLQKLQEKFNSSSACADLIKYAEINDIKYVYISGHEGGNYYRYELDDILLNDELLYDENKNIIIPSFYNHPINGVMKIYLRNGNLYMSISYKNNKKNGFTKCYSKKTQKLLWEKNYTDDKLDGKTKKYYENGMLEKEETFVMGVKEGWEYSYNETEGYLEEAIMYANNVMNGAAFKYYKNGQVKHEAYFENDKQDGITKMFYQSSQSKLISYWKSDKREGIDKEYYETGELQFLGYWKNGKRNGLLVNYHKNGKIRSITTCKNDIYILPEYQYYEDGTLEAIIPAKDTGVEVVYHPNGKLKSKKEMKNGKKCGNGKYYFYNGKIEADYNYKNDKRHGICKKYYENGNLHEELLYINGKISGIGTCYYKNGKVQYKCEYKNGLRDGYSISYDKEGNISQKVLYKKGLVVDFNDNDGVKGILKLKEADTKENKKTNSEVFVTSDGTENKLKNDKKSYIKSKINSTTSGFNLNLVNCSRDIKFITNKIIENRNLNFSMCIYGDPGTGKSAYARYLADKFGIDVVCKTAADILDQYVGNSEKQIAEAFEEAKEKKAMLIIDEVDSFLRSRGLAQRNWEVTIVNQMLTCMENFNYPFICTTNFIDSLDQASLRRFTFKFKFGFLKSNQIEDAFNYVFNTKPSEEILKMKGLTVSDFVNIKKECDILGITDINEIAKMLDETVSLKESEDLSTNVGFN